MSVEGKSDVTQILQDWIGGDAGAQERLMPLVYEEMRRIARSFLSRERPGHTLQPTALVNEAYLRLVGQNSVNWQGRAHFYSVAASMMRRVLIDHARTRAAGKRGGAAVRLSLEDVDLPAEERAAGVVAMSEALERLSQFDERGAKIVEMRFFGGMSDKEIAEVLGVSTRTVLRDWGAARLWLFRELSQDPS
jgi:RNA polymerase sigma-70 factor, ECF subfamily